IQYSRRIEIVEESRWSKKRRLNVVGQSKKSDNHQQSKNRNSRRKATKRQFYFSISRYVEQSKQWKNGNSWRIGTVGESK
uniref:Uncharacterized protein n=1 Tax=Romanomermis culicivorax TaxID=13658 RepID=A0A915I136_ROMCU